MNRGTLFTLLAGVSMLFGAAPASAIDSASCKGPGEVHAKRPFTISADTSPIFGNFTYRFDLDNDGTYEVDAGTSGRTNTEKPSGGNYTIGVSVTDNDLPANDPKHEAHGTCVIPVVNDPPRPYFEMHPLELGTVATAYEALRFTFEANDDEDSLNQVLSKIEIDYDADGQPEFSTMGDGETYVSLPSGFDKDVTLKVTDQGGTAVTKAIHVKVRKGAFGFGSSTVIAPLGTGALGKVTATAPKSINRKTLLRKGLVASFLWGPVAGIVTAKPTVKYRGQTVNGFSYDGPNASYAPGEKLKIGRFGSDLAGLIRKGAKSLKLAWTAHGFDGRERKGTLTVRITG